MKFKDFFDRKLFKFILVGIINTIIGSVIMFSLYNLAKFSYWLASASNIVLVSILSFFLNKYFTFGVRQWSIFMVISFITTIVISYLVAYGISKPVMARLLLNSSVLIRENGALFFGMCIFTVINYLGQRLFVFREKVDK